MMKNLRNKLINEFGIKNISILKYSFLLLLFLWPSLAYCESSIAKDIEGVLSQSSNAARILQIIAITTVIGLSPSMLVMITSFVRISIVFSFVRNALGLQQTPSNQIVVSVSFFLTLFVMSSTMSESYDKGIKPWLEGNVNESTAVENAVLPFKKFMSANTRAKDMDLFIGLAKLDNNDSTQELTVENLPFHVVTPAFMISELRRAFEIGFLIFLPFIIIDILIASILMAMGMMMMPPVMVSLPFKIVFFVIIDGWYILAGSLVRSFVT